MGLDLGIDSHSEDELVTWRGRADILQWFRTFIDDIQEDNSLMVVSRDQLENFVSESGCRESLFDGGKETVEMDTMLVRRMLDSYEDDYIFYFWWSY